jgi:hypothetical protein
VGSHQYMPQPFKHPKTGVFYYRRVVPHSLRAALGRTEFRLSLGTKDLREAKRRYPEKAAEVDALIARASGTPVTLTHREIIALAGKWYWQKLDHYHDSPGDPVGWDIWQDLLLTEDDGGHSAAFLRSEIDRLLADEGLAIDERSRAALDDAVLDKALALADRLIARANGDYRPDPLLATLPEWEHPARKQAGDAVTIAAVFNAWAAERQFAPKTKYSWEKIIGKLTKHLGHDDIMRIADTDIIGWKDALVASGLSPKTIENHLTIIKSFFRWAAKNRRISINPAANVEYRAKTDPAKKRRSYSDDEARCILVAARQETDACKRWVPWLATFTGARLDELCGAMVADVWTEKAALREDGIAAIRIDPVNREEGGSVKNQASIRTVPLHPALIAEGFLEYVASLSKNGPLFPTVEGGPNSGHSAATEWQAPSTDSPKAKRF